MTQVLKYIAEREAAAATEADGSIDPAAMKLMWGVVRLLSQNRGSLSSAPEQAKAKPVQPSIGVLTILTRPMTCVPRVTTEPHPMHIQVRTPFAC